MSVKSSAQSSFQSCLFAFALLAVASLAASAVARADDLIYSQPAVNPVVDDRFSTGGLSSVAGYNLFTLSQDATITTITFEGAWLNGSPMDNGVYPVPVPSASQFDITIGNIRSVACSDVACTGANLFGGILFNAGATPSQANETYLTSQTVTQADKLNLVIPAQLAIYTYSYTLPTPLDLTAGTYVFDTAAEGVDLSTENYWLNVGGSGGSQESFVLSSVPGPEFTLDKYDQAFSLYGTLDGTSTGGNGGSGSGGSTAMPEPSSISLLALCLLPLCAVTFFTSRKNRVVAQ